MLETLLRCGYRFSTFLLLEEKGHLSILPIRFNYD